MTRKRTSKPLAIAYAIVGAFMLVFSMLLLPASTSTMPVASADALSNGLTVTCSQDSDTHATCIIGGCPRVNGDYVVDAVHANVAGQITSNESQHEYEFKCI